MSLNDIFIEKDTIFINNRYRFIKDNYSTSIIPINDGVIVLKDIITNTNMHLNKFSFDLLENDCIIDSKYNDKKYYIYKNKKIELYGDTYKIDIYYSIDHTVSINLEKQLSIEMYIESISMDKYSIGININSEIYEDSMDFIIVGEKNKIPIYNIDYVSRTLICVNIELNIFDELESGEYYLYIQIADNLIPIICKDDFMLRDINMSSSNNIKYLCVKSDINYSILNFSISDEIIINPIADNIYFDNNYLIIKGYINSNIYIQDNIILKSNLILYNKEMNVTIEEDILLYNQRFECSIDIHNLFNIKNISFKSWTLSIVLKDINNRIVKSLIKNSNAIEINRQFIDKLDTVDISISSSKKNKLLLYAMGRFTIKDILSININAKEVEFKFRTNQNIENLLDMDEVKTSILMDNDKLIEPLQTKKLGKKTYISSYKIENIDYLIANITRGVNLVTTVYGKNYLMTVSDINKSTIYNNTLDRIK
ncbi:MAG: hypothetical protein R3Y64_10415, partial [Peptostreptococcaceae bacterium]